MKPGSFRKRVVWAIIAFVMVVMGVLSTNPTVVNALKRLLGYVPNVGIIDQSSQVMVLSEPVTMAREGFALTIEQAVLSAERLTIVFSYSVPEGFMSTTDVPGIFGDAPYVILPDGTRLDMLGGGQVSHPDCLQCTLRYAVNFSPVPNNLEAFTLELPTLVTNPVGVAPENWSIPLQLRVAGPDDIAPVIEVEITPQPTSTQAVLETPTELVNTYGITNTLEKVAVLPDGYVLYGTLAWSDANILPFGAGQTLASITDANGADVPFEYDDPGIYALTSDQKYYWAYKVGSDFAPPLKFNFVITASLPADGGSFTFDPGPNPQLGQKWDINQDVTVNGQVIHVLTAEQAGIEPGFFQFMMQSDSNIIGASITDLAHPPVGFGGGGGGVPEAGVPFAAAFQYQMPLPQGPFTYTFTNIQEIVSGEWTLGWSP